MKNLFSAIYLILTLNCEQSARLTCESFERQLSRSERIALRAHQWVCRSSRELSRQLRAMDAALKREFSSSSDRRAEDHVPLTELGSGAVGRVTLHDDTSYSEQEGSVLRLSEQAKNRILSAIRQTES
jgi:hypothetical protein